MTTKNTGMALANELADVAKEAMFDFGVLMIGAELVGKARDLSQDELGSLLFKYTAELTATVSTRLTHVLLTETQLKDMIGELKMFDEIGKSVLSE